MNGQDLDLSVNLMQSLLRMHNNATALKAIIQAKQTWYDTNLTTFWEDWITDVFDLRTANDFGCVVWSIILGMPLSVVLSTETTKNIFGFGEYYYNFYNSNFHQDQQTFDLTTAQKRIVLRLRFFQLLSNGTVTQTNRFLSVLFGDDGGAYVLDNNDMTISYVFQFDLPSALKQVFDFFDLLPRPAGVKIASITSET